MTGVEVTAAEGDEQARGERHPAAGRRPRSVAVNLAGRLRKGERLRTSIRIHVVPRGVERFEHAQRILQPVLRNVEPDVVADGEHRRAAVVAPDPHRHVVVLEKLPKDLGFHGLGEGAELDPDHGNSMPPLGRSCHAGERRRGIVAPMRTTARDIVIVGGGPAGLVTALVAVTRTPTLAARIVVLEGERYPRDKYCAGALGGRGERLLSTFSALPDVPRVTIRAASLEAGRGVREVRPEQPIGSVVRRVELDAGLARLAGLRGVHIEQGVRVRELVRDPDGVRVVTSAGDLRAACVVGADGVGSVVRRGAFPLPQARAQVLEIDTERVVHDGPADAVHFDLADPSFAGYFWDFPTPIDGKIHASRGVYVVKAPGESVDLDALLDARLRRIGLRLADHPKKRYGERGFPLEGNLSDARTMLVGEAAGIDPVTGEGIAQAIEYGVLAGDFLAAGHPVRAWTSVLRASRLGRDLRVRTLALRPFYGAARARALRLLEQRPELLEAAARHFGGLPQRTGALALGALHVAKAATVHRFSEASDVPKALEIARRFGQ